MLLVRKKSAQKVQSMASAAFHNHVLIFFQIDIRFVQIVENGNRA